MKKITNEQGQTIEISDEKYNELFPKPTENWRAEEGESYYFFNSLGYVDNYIESGDETDNYRYESLNYFQTEDQAHAHRERQLAIGRVTRAINDLNGDWEADWEDEEQPKWSVAFWHSANQMGTSTNFDWELPLAIPYMASEEIAEQVIKGHEADLKIILGIK